MKPFEIFIVSILWGSGGKNRPVLLYALDNKFVRIYPITTQYENKSKAIRAKYFKMNSWAESGLDRQSYIDTGTRLKQPLSLLDNAKLIGELSAEDKQRLLEFLMKQP